jgi:hypothetical protein
MSLYHDRPKTYVAIKNTILKPLNGSFNIYLILSPFLMVINICIIIRRILPALGCYGLTLSVINLSLSLYLIIFIPVRLIEISLSLVFRNAVTKLIVLYLIKQLERKISFEELTKKLIIK